MSQSSYPVKKSVRLSAIWSSMVSATCLLALCVWNLNDVKWHEKPLSSFPVCQQLWFYCSIFFFLCMYERRGGLWKLLLLLSVDQLHYNVRSTGVRNWCTSVKNLCHISFPVLLIPFKHFCLLFSPWVCISYYLLFYLLHICPFTIK